jgi:multidrug resistance efflux pump
MATVPGKVTNFDLLPGDYANAGHAVMALVATETPRVEGYFEDSKFDKIQVVDPATVRLLGGSPPLHGRMESISGCVADRERGATGDLLASINPTFSWVRFAQPIPARIKLQDPPPDFQLTPGRTAAVCLGAAGTVAAGHAKF